MARDLQQIRGGVGSTLGDLFDKNLVPGDIMTVDYALPLVRHSVSVNGKVKGIISREHLYIIVLKSG